MSSAFPPPRVLPLQKSLAHSQEKKKKKKKKKKPTFHISTQKEPNFAFSAMTKIDALRRFLLPCFSPSTAAAAVTAPHHTTKKRISTSLRDDLPDDAVSSKKDPQDDDDQQDPDSSTSTDTAASLVPSRPSKTMVIGTIFGNRRGHVWLCFQHDRLATKPLLLLELSIPTHQLVKEMKFGLVRIALECTRPEFRSCPLRSVPVWAMNCNGKKLGFAARRKVSERNRQMLKTMQSTTVGAGVIPAGVGSPEEVMYMRANYEHVVGSTNSESFHLINPDEWEGQELGVFLIRSC